MLSWEIRRAIKHRLWIWYFRRTKGYVPYDFRGEQWTATKRLSVIVAHYANGLSSVRRDLQRLSRAVKEFLSGSSRITKTGR